MRTFILCMKGFIFSIFIVALLLFFSCKNKADKISVSDTRENPETEIPLYLDSNAITAFLIHYQVDSAYAANLRSFYKKRGQQSAWMNSAALNEYAQNFMNLLSSEKKKSGMQSLLFYRVLPIQFKLVSREDYAFKHNKPAVIELELLLTLNFFDYSKRNWSGRNNEDRIKVSWFIERQQLNYENLLDTLFSNKPHNIASFEPFFRQYHLLKTY